MLPIAVLPAAGLLLGIGGALSNTNIVAKHQFLNQFWRPGIIGSIAIGLLVSSLHNKFHQIQLPRIFGFFSGSRFVPIISSFMSIFLDLCSF